MSIPLLLVGLFIVFHQEVSCRSHTETGKTGDFNMEKYVAFVYEKFPRVTSRTFWKEAIPWPKSDDGLVYIPYITIQLDPKVHEKFKKVIEAFNRKSCIRWHPYKNDGKLYVRVQGVEPDGNRNCRSNLGMGEGDSYMHLKRSCLDFKESTVAHEMMHKLGFIHEHQRHDRDCYIHVDDSQVKSNYNNIGQRFNATDETFPYDQKSVMQYIQYMRSLTGVKLGPETDLPDESDWIRINYAYCDGPHICETHPQLCAEAEQVLRNCKALQKKVD